MKYTGNYHKKFVENWMGILDSEQLIDYCPKFKEKAYEEVQNKLPDFFEKWGENWDDPFIGSLEQRLTCPDDSLREALEDFNESLEYGEIIILEYEDPYYGFGSLSGVDVWRNKG